MYVGRSTGHVIGLIVPANDSLVLRTRPAPWAHVYPVLVSFIFPFLSFCFVLLPLFMFISFPFPFFFPGVHDVLTLLLIIL